MNHYIPVGQRRLRCGHTTGSCAAAAARAAAERLIHGKWPGAVVLTTPAGIVLRLEPEEMTAGPGWASCAIRKDGGDDPDVTDGALIFARVEKGDTLTIDGGAGVGRVTKPGLDQPPGAAAINSVPRRMIAEQLALAGLDTGSVTISVPGGEALAARTFNPRLGIEGGISILGTTGIVRPMSEAALIESIRLELQTIRAGGAKQVLLTPGNYGETFCRETLGLSLGNRAICSNYLGEAMDHAALLGFSGLLLVGHLGKLVKVAGGAMNTHSRAADGRRETLTAHAALCGGDRALLQAVFESPTTDRAVELLEKANLRQPVMASLAAALEEHLRRRAGDMKTGAIFFSNQFGILGKTAAADELLRFHKEGFP